LEGKIEIVKKRLRKLPEYVRKIREESFNDGCAKESRKTRGD